jgi:hypothetical protein
MTHRDEFLADYSLAGCFPAEPAAASSAAFILNQKTFVRKHFSANGNCSLIWLSHFAAVLTIICYLCVRSGQRQLWRPQGDSNPCYRRERAVS